MYDTFVLRCPNVSKCIGHIAYSLGHIFKKSPKNKKIQDTLSYEIFF